MITTPKAGTTCRPSSTKPSTSLRLAGTGMPTPPAGPTSGSANNSTRTSARRPTKSSPRSTRKRTWESSLRPTAWKLARPPKSSKSSRTPAPSPAGVAHHQTAAPQSHEPPSFSSHLRRLPRCSRCRRNLLRRSGEPRSTQQPRSPDGSRQLPCKRSGSGQVQVRPRLLTTLIHSKTPRRHQ